MIFKIPAVPSASYLADGLVITSTLSMASAGSCRNASVEPKPAKAEGRPLIRIRTFSFPLRLIAPSTSTLTDGTLFNASLTVAPLVVISFPMLYIFLSNLTSTVVFSPTTSTASNCSTLIPNFTVPRSLDEDIFWLSRRKVV